MIWIIAVYINKTQYFEGVEPEVWAYQTGGYQVLDKWLKDRKGRTLCLEDVHYSFPGGWWPRSSGTWGSFSLAAEREKVTFN